MGVGGRVANVDCAADKLAGNGVRVELPSGDKVFSDESKNRGVDHKDPDIGGRTRGGTRATRSRTPRRPGKGRAFFEEEILRRHRELRTRLSTYVLNARPAVVLTAPIIYAVIVPLVLLDLFVTVYQSVCFPVYGIPKVRRREYLISTGTILLT